MSDHRKRATIQKHTKSKDQKALTENDQEQDIGFFVHTDYSNFVKSRLRTDELLCSINTVPRRVLIGTTNGRVFFFDKKEGDVSDERSFNGCPVHGIALDLRGNFLVIQDTKIHSVDSSFTHVEMGIFEFTDEIVTHVAVDPLNKCNYCCILRDTKQRSSAPLMRITLFGKTDGKQTIINEKLPRQVVNQIKWVGSTLILVISNKNVDGSLKDVVVYFYDIPSRKSWPIPFGTIEVKSSVACCVSPLNDQTVVVCWGNIRGEFMATPGFSGNSNKTYHAPTTFFLPQGVNEVYSLGLLDEKLIGFVSCKDQKKKFGLKVLESNDEREKRHTLALIPKEDITEYFEMYTDENEDNSYVWMLTDRKFLKIKTIQDNDIIELWKEQKRYDLILRRVLQKNMNCSTEELINYWESLILLSNNDSIEIGDIGYGLMDEFIDYEVMGMEDFLEIAFNFEPIHREFREKDSKEFKEYEKLETAKKFNLESVLLFFTNYIIYSLKRYGDQYYDILTNYKRFFNNREHVYAYEDAFNTLRNYAKLKGTIQRIEGVIKYDQIPKDELLKMMKKELDKYQTLIFYPNVPTSYQQRITEIIIGNQFENRSDDRIVFQTFNTHYYLDNSLFKEAQDLILTIKEPQLFLLFLEKIQTVSDFHLLTTLDNDLSRLASENVSEVVAVMKKADKNPLLQFRLYQNLFKLLTDRHKSLKNYEDHIKVGIPSLLYCAFTRNKDSDDKIKTIVISFIKETIKNYNNLQDFKLNKNSVELISSVMEIVNSLKSEISKQVLRSEEYGNKKWIITLLYELSAYKDSLLSVLDSSETMELFSQSVCDGLRSASLRVNAVKCLRDIATQEQFSTIDKNLVSTTSGILLDDNFRCSKCSKEILGEARAFKCNHVFCLNCITVPQQTSGEIPLRNTCPICIDSFNNAPPSLNRASRSGR